MRIYFWILPLLLMNNSLSYAQERFSRFAARINLGLTAIRDYREGDPLITHRQLLGYSPQFTFMRSSKSLNIFEAGLGLLNIGQKLLYKENSIAEGKFAFRFWLPTFHLNYYLKTSHYTQSSFIKLGIFFSYSREKNFVHKDALAEILATQDPGIKVGVHLGYLYFFHERFGLELNLLQTYHNCFSIRSMNNKNFRTNIYSSSGLGYQVGLLYFINR